MASAASCYSVGTNYVSESLRVSGEARDPRIQQMIDESFKIRTLPLHEKMLKGECLNYLCWGSLDYTFNDRKYSILGLKASEIAEEFAGKESFDVLDLGTGNGLFLKGMKDRFKNVSVLGISAADCRSRNGIDEAKVPNEEYIVANLENLNQISALKDRKFDFIVSSMTFMHLCDPIGTICQVYERLKPNGIFVIDRFKLNGINGQDYIKIFEDSGCKDVEIMPKKYIKLGGQLFPNEFNDPLQTIIRKTTEHLKPSLYYDLESSTKADSDNQAHIFYKL